MKILFDHQRFGTQKYGGVSRYFCELASNLGDLPPHEVEIFAPLYVNDYIHNVESIRPRGFRVPQFRYSGLPIGLVNKCIAAATIRSRRDIDIFHETYYSVFDCGPRSAKKLLTVFDMVHERYPRNFSGIDRTRHAKAAAVDRSDHIICISENTRRDLIDVLGVPPEKTSVVYLGHALQASPAMSPVGTTSEHPFILYVGARGGYKNFSALVRAYASSKARAEGLRLVCFGGGPFSGTEISHLRDHGIGPELAVTRSGGDGVLADLYRRATLLVYPSLYEGFGIPPLEAMALGCPVACSNTSSLPEVVGVAAELFDPEVDDQIVAAIERVIFSGDRARALRQMGLERARMFSWRQCAIDTLAVYQRVLEGQA